MSLTLIGTFIYDNIEKFPSNRNTNDLNFFIR